MRDISIFYTNALNDFADKRKSRKNELCAIAEVIEKQIKTKHPSAECCILCDKRSLDDAIVSYFYEIHRFKHFHGMLDNNKNGKVNYHKVFSFTAKWILRERPFTLRMKENPSVTSTELLKDAALINEHILINWMRFVSSFSLKADLSISTEETEKILYSMKYRDFSTGFFELFLMSKIPPQPPETTPSAYVEA